MEASSQSLEVAASATAAGDQPKDNSNSEEEKVESDSQEEVVIDVSEKSWEFSLLDSPPPADGLYIYRNSFHLVPSSIGRLGGLKTLKFFANDVEILPPEAGDLVQLERLQLKFSWPGVSGLSFEKLKCLKELELCKVPPRPSTFSVLGEIGSLKCLTKLSICHFSIRYLPPEIGCLKKLEELDLSFNKLKNLPNDIAELNCLRSLRVANNKLVDLPSGISSLRSLENLDLSNNRLTSLTPLKLASMQTLQYLNLQYNKLRSFCQIPSWIRCDVEGNDGTSKDDIGRSLVEVNVSDVAIHRGHVNRSCNGCHSTSPCYYPEGSCRCSTAQRMRKGWKRRDSLQQKARQERLNYSRKWRMEDHSDDMTVNMTEENDSCRSTVLEDGQSELQFDVDNEKLTYSSAIDDISHSIEDDGSGIDRDSLPISHKCGDTEKIGLNKSSRDDCSLLTESSSLRKDHDYENATASRDSACPCVKLNVPDESSSSEVATFIVKSKRHCDIDLDNPKPSKFRRPVEKCSFLSCKYNTESFCSIDDHLPDGFYDAGRDRPFMSLQDYEQSLCIDSREVILLDREKDEELDAIASSALMLLSTFRRTCSRESREAEVDNLERASILALFVSDCFGGSDRSSAVLKLRKRVIGANKQQPFICTCSAGNNYDIGKTSMQAHGIVGNPNFNDLCENSLRLIKETRNSNVVPIGTLRFGVCRHRAVLMKYLCDRADPPIPCELVRGYLDFMPHAWNAILVRIGNLWARMIVDACYPTDIREETDLEYYCRYVPLSRVHVPLATDDSSLLGCSFASPSLSNGIEKAQSCSVFHCKFGTIDAAVKVRSLEASEASQEEIRNFEYTFLGEVRMLGAVKKHSCIVEIYGHQLSSKWVPPADGTKETRLLQSMIVMEYVKGGSVKSYLEKLSERGEKHAPIDMVLCIAKAVACALVELHSKHIIHRDIKSENILIDMDSNQSDATPVVKLADFDRSVPLQASVHTCCIAHVGIHPPDACVGTPRWMAPEVVHAMHQRKPYGLEVDIWSFGCLLSELLTLEIPYNGQSEAELYDLLQRKQRPRLTPELEALSLSVEADTRSEQKIPSDGAAETLKLVIDLFYECTSGNPSDRPTAKQIYNKLCAIPRKPDTSQASGSSS